MNAICLLLKLRKKSVSLIFLSIIPEFLGVLFNDIGIMPIILLVLGFTILDRAADDIPRIVGDAGYIVAARDIDVRVKKHILANPLDAAAKGRQARSRILSITAMTSNLQNIILPFDITGH